MCNIMYKNHIHSDLYTELDAIAWFSEWLKKIIIKQKRIG